MEKPVYTFVERLNQGLEIRGITKSELSRRTGINLSTMCQYAKGKYSPKADYLRKIAIALNVSEPWLMGYDIPLERQEDMQIAPNKPITDEERYIIEALRLMTQEQKEMLLAMVNTVLSQNQQPR